MELDSNIQQKELNVDQGYSSLCPCIIRHWSKKSQIIVPKSLMDMIALYTKIPVTFNIKALDKLNLNPIPIKGTNNNKRIHYVNYLDMREIFTSLDLSISTDKNRGFYEIDFKIHRLTLQGIKFGLIPANNNIYSNNVVGKRQPFEIIGGYIGVFTNKSNKIVCWDGFTKNIINGHEWTCTNHERSLNKNDIITMIIDTKYKTMHLILKRKILNHDNKYSEHNICDVPFANCLETKHQSIIPCVSLIFHNDSVEILSIKHFILNQYFSAECISNNIQNKEIKKSIQRCPEIDRKMRLLIWIVVFIVLNVCMTYFYHCDLV